MGILFVYQQSVVTMVMFGDHLSPLIFPQLNSMSPTWTKIWLQNKSSLLSHYLNHPYFLHVDNTVIHILTTARHTVIYTNIMLITMHISTNYVCRGVTCKMITKPYLVIKAWWRIINVICNNQICIRQPATIKGYKVVNMFTSPHCNGFM